MGEVQSTASRPKLLPGNTPPPCGRAGLSCFLSVDALDEEAPYDDHTENGFQGGGSVVSGAFRREEWR